mmetsp:Transcript_13162/g.33726  ORF Transcript_13162/g.33726 Transcript_13162/m.33726 type:complete len:284 (+) Transcript_13162:78-929(+)
MSRKSSTKRTRNYGSDEYWIDRYATNSPDNDETNEWLLSAAQLGPLLSRSLPKNATVVDVGCGNSTLVFDLLRDTLVGDGCRAVGVDIAPGAIAALAQEQRERVRRGEKSARRAELLVADLTSPSSKRWIDACHGGLDACIDKSTTDGMLCDIKCGADRVRAMYEVIGRELKPKALVVVVSWRSPDDDLAWLLDVVLGGLRAGSELGKDGAVDNDVPVSIWSLDIHSVASGDDHVSASPHVYLLSKHPRRVLRRKSAARRGDAIGQLEAAEELMTVRQHFYDA